MEFRTQIEIPHKPCIAIGHDQPIVMLGSCFTDNIGAKLDLDGFDVMHNPMGALYNPASISTTIKLALDKNARKSLIIRIDNDGNYHCLNFASRYVADSKDGLLNIVNTDLDLLGDQIVAARILIITLGTAYVFDLADSGDTVGNCHKYPADVFCRHRLTHNKIVECLQSIISLLPDKQIIFTVSPIRHVADGLHGNQLSKASLMIAVDEVVDNLNVHYFPAYEIVLDDLRDYRFYAPDMKHPSTVAIDYIYEVFSKYYFTPKTIDEALLARKRNLRLAHRQILP